IAAHRQADAAAVALLDTLAGMSQHAADGLRAEIGTVRGRCPSATQLASWAGMCPGHHESAGKQLHGTTRTSSPWWRQLVLEAALMPPRAPTSSAAPSPGASPHDAAPRKPSLPSRTGSWSSWTISWRATSSFQDRGTNVFDERDRQALPQQLVRRLEHLGYDVALQPSPPAA